METLSSNNFGWFYFDIVALLETQHPGYRLSDTVLYSAIKFLEDEKAIAGYWKKVQGRGRPRRMYQINPQCKLNLKTWLVFGENISLLTLGSQ